MESWSVPPWNYSTELKPDPETSPLLVSHTHTNTELLCLYKHWFLGPDHSRSLLNSTTWHLMSYLLTTLFTFKHSSRFKGLGTLPLLPEFSHLSQVDIYLHLLLWWNPDSTLPENWFTYIHLITLTYWFHMDRSSITQPIDLWSVSRDLIQNV